MKTKTQFTKQILSVVLCFALVLSCVPFTGVTVSAAEVPSGYTGYNIENGDVNITQSGKYYIYGTNKEVENTISVQGVTAEIILENVNAKGATSTMESGMSIRSGADVTLKLKGTNTLRGETNGAGIEVPEGATLTITSYSGDGYTDGVLNAYGGDNGSAGGGAGIGARGYYIYTNTCGTINIKGGTVNAVGDGGGAGIGGSSFGTTGTIIISGGNVTARSDANTAGLMGAGIGGGNAGYVNRIEISGGNVTANGSRKTTRAAGAAIGSGENSNYTGISCGEIVISGGTVVANGNVGYGGVREGVTNSGGSVTISNGVDLTVNDGEISPTTNGYFTCNVNIVVYDQSIVSDQNATLSFVQDGKTVLQKTVGMAATNYSGKINLSFMMDQIHLNKSTNISVTVGSETYTATITLTESLIYAFGNQVLPESLNVSYGNVVFNESGGAPMLTYYDENGTEQIVNDIDLNVTYKITGTTEQNHVEVVKGNVKLILEDCNIKSDAGAIVLPSDAAEVRLTLNGTNKLTSGGYHAGISVHKGIKITIDGDGSLEVTGGSYSAGIGTNDEEELGEITINGGTITAQGGSNGAGIGTGYNISSGGSIIINGGNVTAKGGFSEVSNESGGAGIGGGSMSGIGSISITGGIVKATGAGNSAGIGGGNARGFERISISGGTVTAVGGKHASGIGSGRSGDGNGRTITISGGTITASGSANPSNGQDGGAGIGSGYSDDSGINIIITGGNIKASGAGGAEAVGKGKDASSVTVNNGTDNGSKSLKLVTIALKDVVGEVAVTDIDVPAYYGMNDVVTMDGGKLYLYLPSEESPTSVMLENEDVYEGKVNGSYATFVKIDMSKEPDVDKDGVYLIADIDDLIWFSQYAVIDNTINGRVTANIDASGSVFTTIGTVDAPYAGTFDGGYHSITVDINTGENYATLFDYVNSATIQNLIVEGKITTSAKHASGLIGSSAGTTTVKNVITNVVIASSVNGDGTHGGFVGVASGTLVMENCGFAGEINGTSTTSCGGFIGWANNSTSITIKDSYLAATFGVSTNSGHTLARNYGNASVDITNFYYLNELNETPDSSEITQKSEEQFESGEVTYLLNGSKSEGDLVWYQTVGTDATPQFEGEIVRKFNNGSYGNTLEVTITEVAMKDGEYNGKAHAGYTGTPTNAEGYTGTYEVTYVGRNDTTYNSSNAPVNAGDYTVIISTASDNTDYSGSVSLDFTISQKAVTVTVPEQEIEEGKELSKDVVSVGTLADGDSATVEAVAKGNDCTYTATIVIKNSAGEDVTANYSFANTGTYHEYDWNTQNNNYECINCQEVKDTDTTNPEALYQIGENGFKKFINTITFGLFCKDYKAVEIAATDEKSGVATLQYYVSNSEITDFTDVTWENYSDSLSLNAKGTYFIYARVVDKAGNEAIYNSEGIVIFEDSSASAEIEYTKTSDMDAEAQISFNGNKVKEVKYGENVLIADKNYIVTNKGILFDAEYLDTFAAGEYIITVTYNPQGVEKGEDAYGDVPVATAISLTVKREDGSVTNISNISKTYDGDAVFEPTFDKLGTGKATYEYKVKGADDSTYTTTAPSAAGDYVVQVTVAADNNYKEASATAEFTIGKATLENVSVKQNGELTYNKQAQTATVKTSATAVNNQAVTFTYSTDFAQDNSFTETVPSFTNAGEHLVYYKASAPNHEDYTGHFTVTIDKKTVNEPTIQSKPYTGSVQTAEITDTDLYTVETNKGGTAKGNYDVVLELKDADNYKWNTTSNAEVTVKFQITTAENEWTTAPSIENWTYGKSANKPTYAAKFGTVKVVYTGTANDGTSWNDTKAPTLAGEYTATFTVDATDDYGSLSTEVHFTINKATYGMSNAKWDYTEAFTYDGLEKTVSVVGLPTGVTVSGYTGNTATSVGDYNAKVTFIYDGNNYNTPIVANLAWKIENNWTPTEYSVSTPNSNGWLNADLVIAAQDGFELSLTNTVDGVWSDTLTGAVEGADSSVTFYVRNKDTGAISLQEVVNYKLDKNTETTGTTGKVSFDERNGWETFLNTISFGLFYKDEVTVKVEATDALSGVENIEYFTFESTDGTALTLEQVQAITDWTEMPDDGAPVTVEDTKQFVYYIRVIDKAGNVTYLSTDGAEYDITAPVISGVEDGATYYTTQKVTVTEKNVESITLNGKEATNEITLTGNVDETYTIVVTDKAGNSTTIVVTMKKLTSQSTQIEDTTPDNVKTDDKQKIEDIKKELEAIDTTNATDAEKEEIKKQLAKCEELLKKIEELKKEANSPKTGDYNNLWMLFALLFVSGMSILGITVSDKKRR